MAVENSSSLFPSEPPGDLQTRIGLLFALFFISGVCSLIPVCGAWYTRLRSKRKGSATKEAAEEKPWKQVLLGFLNCFAGGVFLGVTFLHLLPDITEEWEKIFNKVLKTSYPLDQFLVVIGFFMVLVIEQMAYACQSSRPRKKEEKVVPTPAIRSIRIQPNIVASLSRNIEATPLLGGGEGVDCKQCRQEHAHHTQPEVASDSEGEPTHHRSLLRNTSVRYSSPDIVEVDNNEVNGRTGDEGEGKGAQKKNEATTPGGLRAVFLGMALSVHSVFEGLAFGLIQSESDVCTLCTRCVHTLSTFLYSVYKLCTQNIHSIPFCGCTIYRWNCINLCGRCNDTSAHFHSFYTDTVTACYICTSISPISPPAGHPGFSRYCHPQGRHWAVPRHCSGEHTDALPPGPCPDTHLRREQPHWDCSWSLSQSLHGEH